MHLFAELFASLSDRTPVLILLVVADLIFMFGIMPYIADNWFPVSNR
jgi:hypothetical protein